MEISEIRASLGHAMSGELYLYERRSGIHQLMIPIMHEDGDMVDIYIQDSPEGEGYARVCDFGMTLMRLSYTFEISTATRERILDSILINNGVQQREGNLYLDAPVSLLYESILQFAGCVQKVCNMRYWKRETVRSAFYDDLGDYVTTEMERFSPIPNHTPVEHDAIFSVDWFLGHNSRNFYVFGVRGDDKAKNVAINLLVFQNAELPFISLVVHEDMEELGKRASLYLTKNADIQYPALDDFREKAIDDIRRIAA